MTPQDIFMLVVAIVLGAGWIAVIAIAMAGDIVNNASDRHYDRYRRLRDKIMSPKNQKHFFKQIRWFKKLLRNKNVHAHIVDDIVWVRKVQVKAQYNPSMNIDRELTIFPWKVQANEMWKLASHRQVYSAKELKIIDKVNAAIDKEVAETVAAHEVEKAAREGLEAEQKAREEAEARARAQRVIEKSQKLKNAHENKSQNKSPNRHKPCQKKSTHYICKISFGE